jgi:hypothetical protein
MAVGGAIACALSLDALLNAGSALERLGFAALAGVVGFEAIVMAVIRAPAERTVVSVGEGRG